MRAIALAFFAIAALLPLATVLGQAFLVEGRFSLANFGTVLAEARQWGLMRNTLLLGLGTGAGALLLGFPFGFLVTRTDLPLRGLLATLAAVPILLPPLLHAIAWTDLVPIRGGLAAVAVFSLSTFPIVAVFAGRALDRVDARREEAALLAGGPRARARLATRLAAPAALSGAILALVFAVSDFAVTDYLSSVGPKFNVYADEIFTRWQRRGSSGQAAAAAIPPFLLAAAGLLAVATLRRRRALVTLGGDFVPPSPVRLGRGRGPALAFAVLVVGLGAIVPLASLARTAGSFETVRLALAEARLDIGQTIGSALVAAALAAALALVLAHAAVRARPLAARGIETAALLPFAIPAVALAVGLIRVWNRPGAIGLVYETRAVVVLALLARYFVFPFHALTAGLAPLDPSLEEAAATAGVRPLRRFLGLVVPLARPALVSAFLLAFVFAVRELDVLVLLPSGNRSLLFRIYNAIHFNRPAFVAALSLVLVFLTVLPIALYRLIARRRWEVGA